jgi:four helix bundle protein
MQNYRQLSVWRFAHALALNVHRLTAIIPRQHNGGLISQLRRAALSVPANIAEGSSRESNRDFAKFLVIAIASSSELEYHLQFSGDANLIPRHECDARLTEVVQVRRMLIGLLKRVRSSDGPVAVVPPPSTGSP